MKQGGYGGRAKYILKDNLKYLPLYGWYLGMVSPCHYCNIFPTIVQCIMGMSHDHMPVKIAYPLKLKPSKLPTIQYVWM